MAATALPVWKPLLSVVLKTRENTVVVDRCNLECGFHQFTRSYLQITWFSVCYWQFTVFPHYQFLWYLISVYRFLVVKIPFIIFEIFLLPTFQVMDEEKMDSLTLEVLICWYKPLRTFLRAQLLVRFRRSYEGLTLETSPFRIPVRWSIYIINSVDKTKFLCTTPLSTQHHSFFRNNPLYSFAEFPLKLTF